MYTDIEQGIDNLIPKKSQVVVVKCEDKIQLYAVEQNDEQDIVMFQHFSDDLVPTLKTVHKYQSVSLEFKLIVVRLSLF